MSDFKAIMHQIQFLLGLRLRPRREHLQHSADPIAVFKGLTSKRRRVRGGERKDIKGDREGTGEGEGNGQKEARNWPSFQHPKYACGGTNAS